MVLFANQKDLPLDLSSIIWEGKKILPWKMQILDGCVSYIRLAISNCLFWKFSPFCAKPMIDKSLAEKTGEE